MMPCLGFWPSWAAPPSRRLPPAPGQTKIILNGGYAASAAAQHSSRLHYHALVGRLRAETMAAVTAVLIFEPLRENPRVRTVSASSSSSVRNSVSDSIQRTMATNSSPLYSSMLPRYVLTGHGLIRPVVLGGTG